MHMEGAKGQRCKLKGAKGVDGTLSYYYEVQSQKCSINDKLASNSILMLLLTRVKGSL